MRSAPFTIVARTSAADGFDLRPVLRRPAAKPEARRAVGVEPAPVAA
jgi:hypothetical protein